MSKPGNKSFRCENKNR